MMANQIMVNLNAFSREINNKEWDDHIWQKRFLLVCIYF